MGRAHFLPKEPVFSYLWSYVRSLFWVQIYVYLLWFSLPGTSGVLSVREDLRSVITADLSGFQPETWHIRVATIYEIPTPFWQCLTQTTHTNVFKSYNRPKRWKLCSSPFHRRCSQLWRTETPAWTRVFKEWHWVSLHIFKSRTSIRVRCEGQTSKMIPTVPTPLALTPALQYGWDLQIWWTSTPMIRLPIT